MLEASVCIATFRPGGIDVSLAGMRDQITPKAGFEVIVADRRYERRHEEVARLAKRYGVNLIHVPERRRNGSWCSFCSAWNTAFALARGRVVLIAQDWAYCPPGWIEAHLQHHDTPGRYVLGPYLYGGMPELKLLQPFDFTGQRDRGGLCTEPDAMLRGEVLDEVFAFAEGPFDPDWIPLLPIKQYPDQDSRQRPQGPGVPETYVHVKNESMLRKGLYQLNGLDERMERGKGPMDLEFGMRLAEARVELWWEQAAMQMVPDPRSTCRTMPWGHMTERVGGRWSYADGIAYIARRRKEIRAGQIPYALNRYDLGRLAIELDDWRTASDIDVGPLDVPDEVYWGDRHPLWPETD